MMQVILCFLSTALITVTYAAACAEQYPVRTVYQYPKPGHWLGNLAVRANGSILTTDLLSPQVFQSNPSDAHPQPETVGRFPNATGLTGITETSPDTFEVVSGHFTTNTTEAQPGTLRLYRLQLLPASTPVVSLTADLSEIPLLNGLTTLSSTVVLGSDSVTGAVWSIDTQTGAYKKVIQDPLMPPKPPSSPDSSKLGINGLHVQEENSTLYLYFSNTAQGILARIPINPDDGTPAPPTATATRIALNAAASKGVGWDDFALGPAGDTAFACDSRGNSIAMVQLTGSPKQQLIAGNLNSSEVAEPSAVRFGRTAVDAHTLYVSTAGGAGGPINGTTRVGAQLLAIDTNAPLCSPSEGTGNSTAPPGASSSSSSSSSSPSPPPSSTVTFTGQASSAGMVRYSCFLCWQSLEVSWSTDQSHSTSHVRSFPCDMGVRLGKRKAALIMGLIGDGRCGK